MVSSISDGARMPLLDHFNPPLSRTHLWRAFHGAWAAAIARLLNQGVLPPGYYAVPFVDSDGPVEIDVAALQELGSQNSEDGGSWSPAAPALAVEIEPTTEVSVRVDVLTDDGDPRLAATVELASPRIKDRASARRAFAAKCARNLRRGSGLVVVDAVTTRRGDLHAAILDSLGAQPLGAKPAGPSATAYRAIVSGDRCELQAWPSTLTVGRPLPTVPLWLDAELAVPLDLEASHAAACSDIRIRPAG